MKPIIMKPINPRYFTSSHLW